MRFVVGRSPLGKIADRALHQPIPVVAEHLAGALVAVHDPIVSHLVHEDGLVGGIVDGLQLFRAGPQRRLSLLDGPVSSAKNPIEQKGGHRHEEPTLARVQAKHDPRITAETRDQSIGECNPQSRKGKIPTHNEAQPGPQEILHHSTDRMLNSGPENDKQSPPRRANRLPRAQPDSFL